MSSETFFSPGISRGITLSSSSPEPETPQCTATGGTISWQLFSLTPGTQVGVSLMPRRRQARGWSNTDARPFKLLPRGLVAAANVPVTSILAGKIHGVQFSVHAPISRSDVGRPGRTWVLICGPFFSERIAMGSTGVGGREFGTHGDRDMASSTLTRPAAGNFTDPERVP